MQQYTATIIEKTDNTLILIPDIVRPGYIISNIIENDNTVLGAYNIGDKIGIDYEQIKD